MKNVVVISVDTMRADALKKWGGKPFIAPQMNYLAEKGAIFSQIRAESSWTLPSHTSLFTGNTPWAMGVDDVEDKLAPEKITFTEVLRANGYSTFAVVTHLFLDRPYGLAQGFENVVYPESENADDAVTYSISWIRSTKKPYFLFLHLFDAHWPYNPPGGVIEQLQSEAPPKAVTRIARLKSVDDYVKKALGPNKNLLNAARALYYSEVNFADTQLGRLFYELLNADDPPYILLISDHGEAFGEKWIIGHALTLDEVLIHVPVILVGPGIQPGRKVNSPGQLADMPAMLFDLLGIPKPPQFLGRNLLKEDKAPPSISCTSFAMEDQNCAIFFNGYKYAQSMFLRLKGRKIERRPTLYDIADDPNEEQDLRHANPELTDSLRAMLDSAVSPGKDVKKSSIALPADKKRKLKSLGYIQ